MSPVREGGEGGLIFVSEKKKNEERGYLGVLGLEEISSSFFKKNFREKNGLGFFSVKGNILVKL